MIELKRDLTRLAKEHEQTAASIQQHLGDVDEVEATGVWGCWFNCVMAVLARGNSVKPSDDTISRLIESEQATRQSHEVAAQALTDRPGIRKSLDAAARRCGRHAEALRAAAGN